MHGAALLERSDWMRERARLRVQEEEDAALARAIHFSQLDGVWPPEVSTAAALPRPLTPLERHTAMADSASRATSASELGLSAVPNSSQCDAPGLALALFSSPLPLPSSPPWSLTHAQWNALMHALWGNTPPPQPEATTAPARNSAGGAASWVPNVDWGALEARARAKAGVTVGMVVEAVAKLAAEVAADAACEVAAGRRRAAEGKAGRMHVAEAEVAAVLVGKAAAELAAELAAEVAAEAEAEAEVAAVLAEEAAGARARAEVAAVLAAEAAAELAAEVAVEVAGEAAGEAMARRRRAAEDYMGRIADAEAEVSAALTDGAAAKLTAARWRAVRVAGEAAAGRRHPATAEILDELATLEEAEAEAEEEAAVEAEQRRHRQGVEAKEAAAAAQAQAEVQAERRSEALAETWRGVELRWAEEEEARCRHAEEARAEPGWAEAETRRRREAAAEARRREVEAEAEAYGPPEPSSLKHSAPGGAFRRRHQPPARNVVASVDHPAICTHRRQLLCAFVLHPATDQI